MSCRDSISVRLAIALCIVLFAGCSRTPEQRYSRYLERGRQHFQRRDFSRAVLDFHNAAQALPKKAEPHYQLGLIYLAEQQPNLAVLSFQQATRLDPNHAEARLQLANLMLTSNKPEVLEEVERMTQKVLGIEPDSSEALRIRAMAELKLGRPEEAVRTMREAAGKAPQSVKAAATLAAMRLAARDSSGAEAVMKRLTQVSPRSADGWLALGHFYQILGRKSEADAAIAKAVEVEPNHGNALFELALMQARSQQMSEAEATFKRLAGSGDPKFRAYHAMFLFKTGKRADSVQELERLVSKYPEDRQVRSRLVMAYLATRKSGDAGKLLQKALKLNPKDVDALDLRARMYFGAGKLAEAAADLDTVLHYRPDSAAAHSLKAKVYRARNEMMNYQQELDEALRIEPGSIETRLEISRSFRATQHPDTALTYLDRTPSRQKGRLDWVTERNWVLLDLRKEAELNDVLTRALKVNRDHELLLQHALLSMRRKQYDAARLSLEEILNSDPENYRALDTRLALFLAQNQRRQSVDWIGLHAARRPNSAAMQHVLAQWLQATGDLQGAREAYLRSAKLDAKFKPPRLELAKLDLAAGNVDASRAGLNDLLAADYRDIPARLLLGAVEEKTGNLVEARESYELVVQADPDNVVALNNLAAILNEHAGNPDKALPYAERAYQLAGASAAVNETLGWIYFQKQYYQKAIPYPEAAVRLQPTANRELHLGEAYHKVGQSRLAEKNIADAARRQAQAQAAPAGGGSSR